MIESEEFVKKVNDISIEQQINRGCGFVAAMKHETIKKIVLRYNQNATDERQ